MSDRRTVSGASAGVQPRLGSARLSLIPVTGTDLDRLHRLLTEPGVRRFLCDDAILPRETIAGLIADSLELHPSGLGLWGVEAGQAWIGCVGLQPVSGAAAAAHPDFAGEVEPLIALHAPFWKRGYAGEALGAAVAYAFGALRLPRLVALVDEPNDASRTLMGRAGFSAIATAQGPRHPLTAYEKRSPDALTTCPAPPGPRPTSGSGPRAGRRPC